MRTATMMTKKTATTVAYKFKKEICKASLFATAALHSVFIIAAIIHNNDNSTIITNCLKYLQYILFCTIIL